MSADNGIYILSTPIPAGRQFRVREMSAVENVEWDQYSGYSTDPDVHIRNARKMWHGCQVFTNRHDALKKADEMYQYIMATNSILEYGISFIEIEREF